MPHLEELKVNGRRHVFRSTIATEWQLWIPYVFFSGGVTMVILGRHLASISVSAAAAAPVVANGLNKLHDEWKREKAPPLPIPSQRVLLHLFLGRHHHYQGRWWFTIIGYYCVSSLPVLASQQPVRSSSTVFSVSTRVILPFLWFVLFYFVCRFCWTLLQLLSSLSRVESSETKNVFYNKSEFASHLIWKINNCQSSIRVNLSLSQLFQIFKLKRNKFLCCNPALTLRNK